MTSFTNNLQSPGVSVSVARMWIVIVAFLLSPVTAAAQSLWWSFDGNSFTTVGPNAAVTIYQGQGVPGTCDFIFPATDIYVVTAASLSDDEKLVDVNGTPNTVQLASGGLFISETVAFTQPGGNLGAGVYGIVYDECQNGKFDVGQDTLFYPAFEVVIPANIPILPNASIQAIKAAAKEEADSWAALVAAVEAVELMIEIKETLECLAGGIGGCLVSTAIGALQDYLIEQARELLGLVDPKEAAKDAVVDTIAHYNGIHADPPDPNFAQLDPLEPVAPIPQTSTDPIIRQIIAIGNAQRTQAVTLEALLHAIERYQGADIAGNADWALVHARSIQSLSNTLRSQLPDSTAALTALDAALTADPRDFNQGIQAAPLIAQIIVDGFQPSQVQALLNAGLPQNQLAALRAHVAAYPWIGVTEAEMHTSIADVLADHVALDGVLGSLAADMNGVITTLLAPPNVTNGFPLPDAGGPYTGTEAAAIVLNASLSTDPGGSIIAYHWDLDRDGQFDDATGATPSVVFPASFNGLIGVRVLDNAGNASIDYAHVEIADANLAPVIDSVAPVDRTLTLPVGDIQTFTVAATDPDADELTVRWLVDFVEVATGPAMSHQLTFNTVGTRIVRVEVSDGTAAGGMVAEEWMVTAEAPDGDGDGWRANADCNDANPAINPGVAEIIGNGIDDDCRADTLDAGSPPVASFTVAPGVKTVGQAVAFTDTSNDPDGPLAMWAWNFGDGQTSNQQSPSHAFATAGTFTVVLTVTDAQGFTATTQQSITATNLPAASFTYAPVPAVRNTPIQFTDTSVDIDGPIASRSWQFGDGGISSDANPIHTFTSAGTFTVTLTVTDSHGATATASQPVVVNPALTDTTSVAFRIRHDCRAGISYRFKIAGVLAGTLASAAQSGCNANTPAEHTLTVNDPAVLALVTAPVCQVFTLESTGTSNIGWARVDIGRPGGTEIVRIVNTNQYDGPTAYSAYANFPGANGGARTFNSPLPNKDGDATPDCSDPDIDNDGRVNGVDNCPLIANATQADGDANGIGDACQDKDADTILDSADNCPDDANTNQFDFDADGVGNACDNDIDADGIENAADNCRYIANPSQANANGDEFGDACDVAQLRFVVEGVNQQYDRTWTMSIDGKPVGTMPSTTVPNTNCSTPPVVMTITDPEKLGLLGAAPTCNAFRMVSDNRTYLTWAKAEIQLRSGTVSPVVIHATSPNSFPTNSACQSFSNTPPTYQFVPPDFDKDGIFDCEDPDSDGDTVPNGVDNCPTVPNTNQANGDANPLGDACQDVDNDGDLDINDNCPTVSNADQANLDGDSFGDVCDTDDDNDTVSDTADNCPRNANTNQSNIDGDALGDACDTDMDGDGDLNTADNCPTMSNSDQRNTDGDAQGDVCDADLDNDGVPNTTDNCLYVSNASQLSTNPYKTGDACIVAPVTVPWLGVPTQPHQVYSGGTLVLQGVAVYENTFLPADILSATWDPGDGTPVKPVNVSNPRALEVTHTYTGAVNTPFRALLTITMLNGATRSDEFRIIIQPKTLDVEANMAIDRGLWNLHKAMVSSNLGTPLTPAGNWTGGDNAAATAAAVQAMLINNHREVNNRLEDPYVDDVTRGLRFLENALSQVTIGVQPAGNPDTNANGIGLQYATQQVYVTGQIADAFVATGTPDKTAVIGHATHVRGRRYRDLVQDMMDAYWWGQTDSGFGRGGWRYGWNGGSDNSTAQWAAIAGLAGHNAWDIPVPQFVKDENLLWVRASHQLAVGANRGSFGYTGTGWAWSQGMSTTPSAMVQLIFDGVRNDPSVTSGDPANPSDEERYQLGLKYIAKVMRSGYHTTEYATAANYYSLFAMAKAFRLAIDRDALGNVVADPVGMIDDVDGDANPPFDWYRNDPATPNAASPRGVARLLISRQGAGGEWPSAGSWPASLSTAYAVIVLSPTIFELGPAASCSAVPSIVNTGDPVTFDGSGSTHNDPFGTITSYTWNFADGTPVVVNASPNTGASHTFTALGTFNVVLTVADQNGLTAQSSCPVTVIDGNRPPIANSGAPYNFCVGSPMILNATGSVDPDGDPLTFQWDLTNPLNFVNPDGASGVLDVTAAFASFVPGTYQIGLRVSDNHLHSTAVFPNITIHAADNQQFCNVPPVATPNTYTVDEDTALSGNVITDDPPDSDANAGDVLSAAVVDGVDHGELLFNSVSGSFTYTPAPNFCGADGFTYTVHDGDVDSNVAPVTINVTCVNDPPVAGDDANATTEDIAVDGSVIGGDTDVENDPLTFSDASDPTHGSVTLHPNGDYTYSPDPNYCGADSFTYRVNDAADSDTAVVTITVACVNDAPVALDGAVTTSEDAPVTGAVSSTDIDGGAPRYSLLTAPLHGVLLFNENGAFTYTPANDYSGPDAFTFSVSDGNLGTDDGVVRITVTPGNDPPVANDSAPSTPEDTPLNGAVSSVDHDGGAPSYTAISGPSHGTLAFNPDGSYLYTPAANYHGPDAFSFTVADGNGGVDDGNVSITVTPVNDPPAAIDSTPSTAEDTALNGSVSSSDSDGGAPAYTKTSEPAHGTLAFNPDGSYLYTPAPDYFGPDAFTFAVADGNGGVDDGSVAITVTPVNDPPTAIDSTPSTPEDTPLAAALSSSDSDGAAPTYTKTSDPAHGTIVVNPDGSYLYTPAANYYGPDAFTFSVDDGNGGVDDGSVAITVTPLNDPPAAIDSTPGTPEDTPLAAAVSSSDSDGGAPTYAKTSEPAHGTLTFNPDGSYVYTPAPDYFGPDAFTFTVADGNGGVDDGSVTITVTPVNDPPAAIDSTPSTAEDTALNGSVSSTDSDGGAPTYAKTSEPAHGTLTFNPDGSYVYTPAPDYFGPDAFTFTVADGNGGVDDGSVTITVTPVNDPPVAADSAPTTAEDTALNGSVSSSDSDGGAPTYTKTSEPAHGTLAFNPDGSYVYTPAPDYFGSDAFTFTVADGNGDIDDGSVTITVTPVNDPPAAIDSTPSTAEDTALNGSVTSTDSDGGAPTYAKTSEPAHGTLALNADGTYVYTPAGNYHGPDAFTFTVDDGNGGLDQGLVTITVTPVNDPPFCAAAGPSIASLWPPDHALVEIKVLGVTDPVENDAITINVDGIFQDEPTNTIGDGNTFVDGYGVGTQVAQVRRERSGSKRVPGDGRMYYINFTGTDAQGGTCTGIVRVGVPHDLGEDHLIGAGGPLYNSVTGARQQ